MSKSLEYAFIITLENLKSHEENEPFGDRFDVVSVSRVEAMITTEHYWGYKGGDGLHCLVLCLQVIGGEVLAPWSSPPQFWLSRKQGIKRIQPALHVTLFQKHFTRAFS